MNRCRSRWSRSGRCCWVVLGRIPAGQGGRRAFLLGRLGGLGSTFASPTCGDSSTDDAPRQFAMANAANSAGSQRTSSRSAALEASCRRLEVGTGAVIADVGCGEGLDAVVFVGSYPRLWKPLPLLRGLKERMSATAWVAVADRDGLLFEAAP